MKNAIISVLVASGVALGGCASNPYGTANNSDMTRAATGAAVGAAAGAVAGKVIGGVSTTEGALAGAVLGGVLGAVINGKQYYRDTRGYCYYVDANGQPVYDYNARC